MGEIRILQFAIGGEKYGIPLERVQQVVPVPEIMPLPEVPEFVAGITNVRGEILLVIDPAAKLNRGRTQITQKCKLIITSSDEGKFAILCEDMPDVVSEAEENITRDLSSYDLKIDPEFVDAVAPERFLVILKPEKLVEV